MRENWSKELDDKLLKIIGYDRKEMFVKFLRDHPPIRWSFFVFDICARYQAKQCLIALIEGELGIPALELYYYDDGQPYSATTPLAMVAFELPDPDVIALMLERGFLQFVNTKCTVDQEKHYGPPLSHVLKVLSEEPPIYSWIRGGSLFKLIILLCQWKMKPLLDSARLLAPHTDSVNDIAWTFVREGDLVSFAALLLLTRQKALLPFDSGLSIRERITKTINELKTEGETGHEVADYTSMLMDACKLLDIFERAGDNLSLYCSSLRKNVAPDKVLIDVAGIFKKAGFLLQPVDLDLRDCYRAEKGCYRVWNANLFKLSDLPIPKSNHISLPSQTFAHGCGAGFNKIPYGETYIRYKLKTGSMLSFISPGSLPRLLSTAAGQVDRSGSAIVWKHVTYAAMKLKRGMRF